jgi:hypothetical protein
MKELSMERMELVSGGTTTTNNCSNIGNALAMSGLTVSMITLAIASGPIGWGLLGLGISFGSVVACQLGYA